MKPSTVCRFLFPFRSLQFLLPEKWVKYANEVPNDDVIHSTKYYVVYINKAILANLQCRTLNLGRLIVLLETHYGYKKFCSHGNSLFSSPHQLDFNMLVIFRVKKC